MLGNISLSIYKVDDSPCCHLWDFIWLNYEPIKCSLKSSSQETGLHASLGFVKVTSQNQVSFVWKFTLSYSRKNPNKRGWGYTFLKKTVSRFVTLPSKSLDKTKLHAWKFHKIVELINSTLFLIDPWKFPLLFLWYFWKLLEPSRD